LVQAAAKKCIFNIAYNLMQNLEVAVNGLSSQDEDDSTDEEDLIQNFIQNKLLLNMIDSVELYTDRLIQGAVSPPMFAAPKDIDSLTEDYSNLTPSKAVNEVGEPAGLFGWCVMSRKPANFYCKESRMPIASLEDKIAFLQNENSFEIRNIETVLNRKA
jgi:hypothetical protein